MKVEHITQTSAFPRSPLFTETMPVPRARFHKTLLSYIPGHKLQTSAPARCSRAEAASCRLPFSSGFILSAAVFIFGGIFDLQADTLLILLIRREILGDR